MVPGMTEFQYSGVVYPNSTAYHDAIAKDWLCGGARTEGEIKSTLASKADRRIAEECRQQWELYECGLNIASLAAAFGRLRLRYVDR